jgi:hypothetical protein
MKQTTTSGGVTAQEFVFECHRRYSDDGSESDSVAKHRLVKKTKSRIYVEREAWTGATTQYGDWQDYVQPTFILDREEFEREGKARRAGRWHGFYYADPSLYHAERRSRSYRPDCLVVLGLPAGASVDEIHSAYRKLARKTHPDLGGDAEEFKQIAKSFEAALAMTSQCAV